MSKSDNQEPETRTGRNQQNDNNNGGNGGIEKIYYIIIGLLLLVLLGIVIFIFSSNGDDTDQVSEEAGQTEVAEETEDSGNTNGEETENEQTTEEESEEGQEEEQNEGEEESNEETEEDDSLVTDDAPHNPNYVPDYSEGSADRLEIASLASQVTGIPQENMVEIWVGNDGPGQVRAEVANPSRSEHYYVYLQYGEGSWFVTNYEAI